MLKEDFFFPKPFGTKLAPSESFGKLGHFHLS